MKTACTLLFLFTFSFIQPNQAAIVEFKKWSNIISKNVPERLCDKGAYYTTCWKLSKNRCRKVVKRELSNCINLLPKRKFVNLDKYNYKYASVVGKCVSKKLNMKLKKKVRFLAKAHSQCKKK